MTVQRPGLVTSSLADSLLGFWRPKVRFHQSNFDFQPYFWRTRIFFLPVCHWSFLGFWRPKVGFHQSNFNFQPYFQITQIFFSPVLCRSFLYFRKPQVRFHQSNFDFSPTFREPGRHFFGIWNHEKGGIAAQILKPHSTSSIACSSLRNFPEPQIRFHQSDFSHIILH